MPARINHYGINESIASQKRYRKQLKRERRLLQELEPPEPTPVDLSASTSSSPNTAPQKQKDPPCSKNRTPDSSG